MPNHVVCLKHGKKYSAEYVNVLYRMVTRNLTVPHNFVCFTEDPTGLDMGIQVKPLQLNSDINGWWYKTMFFNPDFGCYGTVLFLDLDVIVFGNIDKLFTYKPGEFCVIRDFNRSVQSQWDRMNSSCFRLETGQHANVYQEFMSNPKQNASKYHGDQDWLYANVKSQYNFWPDEWIQSYKWEMRGRPEMNRYNGKRNFVAPGEPKILPDTSIAVFHGDPNPKDCIDPWCKENWK